MRGRFQLRWDNAEQPFNWGPPLPDLFAVQMFARSAKQTDPKHLVRIEVVDETGAVVGRAPVTYDNGSPVLEI